MSVVSIVRLQDDDVEDAVRKAVSLSQSFESVEWEGSAVLIKPNVVRPVKSGSGIVTDVRVVEAVTKLVLDRNPGSVIIGEGSSVGYDFPDRVDSMDCMEVAGVLEVAKKFGVKVVDLNHDEQIEVNAPDAFVMDTFAIAKTAWEADVILSLPVIKTHVRTGITCGLKNMKGVLPGREKKRTHQCGLDRAIVDLNRVTKPGITIVDGITGSQGANCDEADQVPLNLILAGNDVVAVDAVCATVAGFDVGEILHVQLAAEAGLGAADLNLIEVRGEKMETVRHSFIPYLQAAQDLYGDANIIEKNSCTGCMGELVSTFVYLKEAGFRDRLPRLTLIMGGPDEIPPLHETPVVVGRCAQKFRHLGVFVPGCPPHGTKITDKVCEALRIDQKIVHRSIAKLHRA
ncbi:MAG: DUF362 domain-containing protein [Deltaproteobacteria bacterium]|nr:MAG: DUF362 domain-containing protein [Deltaproteobacteria bacterium]